MEDLGIYLLIGSVVALLFLTIYKRSIKSGSGSVTIGRDNFGPISVTSNLAPEKQNVYLVIFQYIAAAISIVGVYFTIWPIK